MISQTTKASTLLSDPLRAEIKELVREAVREAMNGEGNGQSNLLTSEELADRLRVPLSWVYEQSRMGNIPTHRLGRYIRFDLHEVLESQKKD